MKSNTVNQFSLLQQVPAVRELAVDADHIDVKSITTDVPMRQFLANMFSYMPKWMRVLYAVRWGFVRLLGMKQTGLPQSRRVAPEEISFTSGDNAAFFQVVEAQEDQYYFAAATEKHLTAHLGVIAEPISDHTADHNTRYHLVTLVHYHHWTGPIYFNAIRPFHHFVVNQMLKAAAQKVG